MLLQNVTLACTQSAFSFSVNLLVALFAAGMAAFFARRPLWLVLQRWVMGFVLGALAVRLAGEQRRDVGRWWIEGIRRKTGGSFQHALNGDRGARGRENTNRRAPRADSQTLRLADRRPSRTAIGQAPLDAGSAGPY